jgi:chromate transporter
VEQRRSEDIKEIESPHSIENINYIKDLEKIVADKINFSKIIISFLKIGTIGFGGGSALIPVIEKEVVSEKGWISEEKFIEYTVAANITPGALPVKLGASTGQELRGSVGAFLGGIAIALPGVFFTVLLVSVISALGGEFLHYIEYASVGISIFIILLLVLYINKVMLLCKSNNILKKAVMIMIGAFLVTAGKELRQVTSIIFDIDIKTLPPTIYDISTFNLMIVSFFLIFFLAQNFNLKRGIYGSILAYVYVDISGKGGLLSSFIYIKPAIVPLMIVSLAYIYFIDKKRTDNLSKQKLSFDFSKLTSIIFFMGVAAILIISAFIIFPALNADGYSNIEGTQNLLNFLGFVFISTITSFGGGEAYISVADGFFVQNGFVPPNIFYGTIVAIANALPGPILVKVATAIGYYFGYTATGQIGAGIMLSIAALSITVGCSCSAMLVVVAGYDALKESILLKSLKLYILPVVCGMLITTSLSMVYEVLKITKGAEHGSVASLGLIALMYSGFYILHKKYHVHDVILISSGSLVTLGILVLL